MAFFRSFRVAAALCALWALPARSQAAAPVITTSADSILIDNAPLFLKGVDYSPYLL